MHPHLSKPVSAVLEGLSHLIRQVPMQRLLVQSHPRLSTRTLKTPQPFALVLACSTFLMPMPPLHVHMDSHPSRQARSGLSVLVHPDLPVLQLLPFEQIHPHPLRRGVMVLEGRVHLASLMPRPQLHVRSRLHPLKPLLKFLQVPAPPNFLMLVSPMCVHSTRSHEKHV